MAGFDSFFDRSSEDFQYIQVGAIKVMPQPRTKVDQDSDKFEALRESIREKGVIQPIVVAQTNEGLRLIAGERRLRAVKSLDMDLIPARILNEGISSEQDILAIQLIENLNRDDLDPIDEAKAYLNYYRNHEGKDKARIQDLINDLIRFDAEPERSHGVIMTPILKIFGKSPSTLRRMLSLIMLKLPLQEAIKTGRLSQTQGYALAENREHARFDEVAEKALAESLPVEKIRAMFREPSTPAKKSSAGRPLTYKSARKKLTAWRDSVLKSVDKYKPKEVEELVKEMEIILEKLKER